MKNRTVPVHATKAGGNSPLILNLCVGGQLQDPVPLPSWIDSSICWTTDWIGFRSVWLPWRTEKLLSSTTHSDTFSRYFKLRPSQFADEPPRLQGSPANVLNKIWTTFRTICYFWTDIVIFRTRISISIYEVYDFRSKFSLVHDLCSAFITI